MPAEEAQEEEQPEQAMTCLQFQLFAGAVRMSRNPRESKWRRRRANSWRRRR